MVSFLVHFLVTLPAAYQECLVASWLLTLDYFLRKYETYWKRKLGETNIWKICWQKFNRTPPLETRPRQNRVLYTKEFRWILPHFFFFFCSFSWLDLYRSFEAFGLKSCQELELRVREKENDYVNRPVRIDWMNKLFSKYEVMTIGKISSKAFICNHQTNSDLSCLQLFWQSFRKGLAIIYFSVISR